MHDMSHTLRNLAWAALVCLFPSLLAAAERKAGDRPNVILILADDLGYGDLGCFGQTKIRTPHLDALAKSGTRFTSAYCGTSVCAPSRCSLMTGLDMGHAPIRANREVQPEGQRPLPSNTFTLPQIFRQGGYRTACVGKWGLGMFDTTGSPLHVGFERFFGYNCQRHAHNYFPKYLYRDDVRFDLPPKTYAQDVLANETLAWVKQHADEPFFLFYALTLPHGKYEIPTTSPYEAENWPEAEKTYAAMVTRMDTDIGRLLAFLDERKLRDNTLVIFASDNGAADDAGGHKTEFFDSNGPFRGTKRSMYEGGLRVPAIASWPGQIPAGKSSAVPWAFWDILPTCAALVNQPIPVLVELDGKDVLDQWKGGPAPEREAFYWELHEGMPKQAVRFGDWKAIRNKVGGAIELYDLATDPAEARDLAAEQPKVLARGEGFLQDLRTHHPDFLLEAPRPKAKKQAAKQPAGKQP